MSYGTGLAAQLGFAAESPYATRAVPSKFIEFTSESLRGNYGRIESKALRAGARVARTDRWAVGPTDVGGSFSMELQSKGLGLLFKHLLGSVATAQPSAGPDPTVYEHTCKMGDPLGLGLTIQVGRPSTDGTVRPWDYTGCKITEGRIAASVGSIPTFDLTVFGVTEDTSQVLAVASYATGLEVLNWAGVTVSIGGTDYECSSVNLGITHAFKTDRFKLGSVARKEPLANDQTPITVEIESEYLDNTAFARVQSGALAAIVLKFTGSTISHAYKNAVEITLPNVRFDGDAPNVNGNDVIGMPLKGVALDDGAAGGAISLVYRTTDATP